jgi:hypothetical protein
MKAWTAVSTLLPVLAATTTPTPSMAWSGDEPLTLVTTIDVGGKGLGAFDISFVDPTIELYVLADRTNGSVDFVDSHENTFLSRVSGFKGVVLKADGTANNALSGPDGVVIVNHNEVWAGDGDSTLKVIDIKAQQITDSISTGGKMRVDEMAWDSRDQIIAVANNADTPPFVTLVSTNPDHKILGKITFDGSNGTPDATNTGIEQPQWSPQTGLFYVSVPQTDPNNAESGGVAVIDPSSMKVLQTFEVDQCTPAGLTLGPNNQALVGCSGAFGKAPNVTVQTVVIDITDGHIVNSYPIGGNDEVWFDAGSQHYYLGADKNVDGSGTAMPLLGVIDARTMQLDEGVPSSTTAHSVAADKFSHHVFLPIGFVPPNSKAGTDPTNICATTGCIAVYVPSEDHDEDMAKK